jgi:hypothetical protein
LPTDARTAALEPTWANVYSKVLMNWEAMAPCMDNWLALGDEMQVKAYSAIIKRLTDSANFEDFHFMPVTRDMTSGERTLLYNFLDDVDPTTTVRDSSNADHSRFYLLSRALRADQDSTS